MYKYKTKDGSDLFVVGYGTAVNGEIQSDSPIENPNLVPVTAETPNEVQPAPAHLNGVVDQNTQPAVQPQPQQPLNGAAQDPTESENE